MTVRTSTSAETTIERRTGNVHSDRENLLGEDVRKIAEEPLTLLSLLRSRPTTETAIKSVTCDINSDRKDLLGQHGAQVIEKPVPSLPAPAATKQHFLPPHVAQMDFICERALPLTVMAAI